MPGQAPGRPRLQAWGWDLPQLVFGAAGEGCLHCQGALPAHSTPGPLPACSAVGNGARKGFQVVSCSSTCCCCCLQPRRSQLWVLQRGSAAPATRSSKRGHAYSQARLGRACPCPLGRILLMLRSGRAQAALPQHCRAAGAGIAAAAHKTTASALSSGLTRSSLRAAAPGQGRGLTARKEAPADLELLRWGAAWTRLGAGSVTCLDVNAEGRLSAAQWSTKHAHNGWSFNPLLPPGAGKTMLRVSNGPSGPWQEYCFSTWYPQRALHGLE